MAKTDTKTEKSNKDSSSIIRTDKEAQLRSYYDARLGYVDLLKEHMLLIYKMTFLRDNQGWIRAINSLYNCTQQFMKQTTSDQINNQLQELITDIEIKQIGFNNNILAMNISKRLNKITVELYKAIAHLLLPNIEEESQEYDINKIIRGDR